jgi:hypothetical protein
MTFELERWVEARPGTRERRADEAPENFAPAKLAFRAQGPDAGQLERMLERLAAQGASGAAVQSKLRSRAPGLASTQAGARAGARLSVGKLAPVLGVLMLGALVIGLTRLSLAPAVEGVLGPTAQMPATRPISALAPSALQAPVVPPPVVPPISARVPEGTHRLPARAAEGTLRPQLPPQAALGPASPPAAARTAVALREPQRAPVAPRVDPLGELSLLQSARRILLADPERALALTDEHRATYRDGMLVEERELLATEALLRLGKRSAASERAQTFRRMFPRSVHNTRLDALLEAPPF